MPAKTSKRRQRRVSSRQSQHDCDTDGQFSDTNEDICSQCLQRGLLVCCDLCPQAFHAVCCDITMEELSSTQKWFCSACRTKRARKGDSASSSLSNQHPEEMDYSTPAMENDDGQENISDERHNGHSSGITQVNVVPTQHYEELEAPAREATTARNEHPEPIQLGTGVCTFCSSSGRIIACSACTKVPIILVLINYDDYDCCYNSFLN